MLAVLRAVYSVVATVVMLAVAKGVRLVETMAVMKAEPWAPTMVAP